MIYKRICKVFVFLLVATNISLAAEELIKPKVRVLEDEIFVGDKITYEIELTLPKSKDAELLDWEESQFSGMAIKDFGRDIKKSIFSKSYRWWFILDTYVSGEYEIASLVLRYKDKSSEEWLETQIDSTFITVKSLLRDSDIDIRDIKGPVKGKAPTFMIWASIAFLLVMICLCFIILFFKRKTKVSEVCISPEQEALTALEALESSSLEELKEFFYELSFIVRRYIERQFMVKAPEMTTEEFIQYTRDGNFLQEKQKETLSSFFLLADMVKFAKYESSKQEAKDSFNAVKDFIIKSAPHESEEEDL